MAAPTDRTVIYTARIDWRARDTMGQWNEYLARVVEVFGLPGHRYRTYVDTDYMDFNFFDEQDRLLFLTGWPAFVPKEQQ